METYESSSHIFDSNYKALSHPSSTNEEMHQEEEEEVSTSAKKKMKRISTEIIRNPLKNMFKATPRRTALEKTKRSPTSTIGQKMPIEMPK